MTKDEAKRALPEMIMFSKTDKEKVHFEKLSKSSDADFEKEVENFVKSKN
jgi:hypothetical protein